MIDIVRTPAELRQISDGWRFNRETVAIVPTMGALHDGHVSLVDRACEEADRVIVSIFVNPRQFAAHEDFGKYPRTEETDLAALESTGVNVIYAPSAANMYGAQYATAVHMEGPAKAGLEDKFRPHFFDGVATVVCKLFTQSRADFAFFGKKITSSSWWCGAWRRTLTLAHVSLVCQLCAIQMGSPCQAAIVSFPGTNATRPRHCTVPFCRQPRKFAREPTPRAQPALRPARSQHLVSRLTT